MSEGTFFAIFATSMIAFGIFLGYVNFRTAVPQADIEHAQQVCQPNGGVDTIYTFQVECKNGATFHRVAK